MRRGKQWGEVAEHRRVSQRLRGQPPIKLHLSPGHPNSAHDHDRIRKKKIKCSSLRVHCVLYRVSYKIHFPRPPLFHVSWPCRGKGRNEKTKISCRYRWRSNRSRPAPKPRRFFVQLREYLSTLTDPGGYQRRYLGRDDRATSVSSRSPQVPHAP